MIEMRDYWMGRNVSHALSLTPQIEHEAERTVDLANKLLDTAALHGIILPPHPTNHTPVSSGWRPPAINAGTLGAAPNSKHMTGRAIDLYDPDGDLDNWLMTDKGVGTLEALGLWMEHPSATKGWCHLQTVPPGSNKRVFYP
jgi:hypothetical protein